jgi:hypothetical protein
MAVLMFKFIGDRSNAVYLQTWYNSRSLQIGNIGSISDKLENLISDFWCIKLGIIFVLHFLVVFERPKCDGIIKSLQWFSSQKSGNPKKNVKSVKEPKKKKKPKNKNKHCDMKLNQIRRRIKLWLREITLRFQIKI